MRSLNGLWKRLTQCRVMISLILCPCSPGPPVFGKTTLSKEASNPAFREVKGYMPSQEPPAAASLVGLIQHPNSAEVGGAPHPSSVSFPGDIETQEQISAGRDFPGSPPRVSMSRTCWGHALPGRITLACALSTASLLISRRSRIPGKFCWGACPPRDQKASQSQRCESSADRRWP